MRLLGTKLPAVPVREPSENPAQFLSDISQPSLPSVPGFDRLHRGLILLLFFCSGATALVYEVVWSKYLALLLGSTIYAQTIVLAVFMGGLALGNRLIGVRADLLARPLAGYGLLEVLIGIYAFGFGWLYQQADWVFIGLGGRLLGHGAWLLLLKAALSTGLLLVPTILMGGTLPLVAAWLARGTVDAGRWSARFYSINSLGAVCGAGAAGFWLIRELGLESAIQMTALLNVIAGFVAIAIGRQTVAAQRAAVGGPMRVPQGFRSMTLLVAITGGVSMGLEVLASRALGLIFGASVQAFAIVLMTFILGIGIGGAMAASPRIRGWREDKLILTLLLGAAAFIGVLVLGIEHWAGIYRQMITGLARTPMGYRFYQLVTGGFALAVLGVPAALIGAVLPLGIRFSSGSSDLGRQVGGLLSWNTLGAVAGVLLTGFILMPVAGLRNAFNLLASALCLAVLARAWLTRSRSFALGAAGLTAGLLLSCVAGGEGWRYAFSSGVFRAREAKVDRSWLEARKKAVKILFYEDAADATVSVEQWDFTPDSIGISLRINGKPEASSKGDLTTQLLLGHLPLTLRPESKRVFLLGLASGISASAVLAHPIEQLVIADNCAPVLRAVHFFDPWNRGVATNPASRIYLEDARTVLKLGSQKFDVIISEPSNPWFAGTGSVFSREFYETVARRLKPDGLMVQWFQTYEIHEGIVKLVLRTFGSVFPQMEIWDSGAGDIILIGSKQAWDNSPERLGIAFKREQVRGDLARLGIDGPETLLARQFASQRTAFAIAGSGPIQSDQFPVLEYEAPKAFFIGTTANLSRFDERTWQSALVSQEKRSALAGLSEGALQSTIEHFGFNAELRQLVVSRLKPGSAAGGFDPLTPCLFLPGNQPSNSVLLAFATGPVKQLLEAELLLRTEGTDWIDQVDLIERLVQTAHAEQNAELSRIAPRALAAAARVCIARRDFVRARRLLTLWKGEDLEQPERAYLLRLAEAWEAGAGPVK